jgi:hypothetical protein
MKSHVSEACFRLLRVVNQSREQVKAQKILSGYMCPLYAATGFAKAQ